MGYTIFFDDHWGSDEVNWFSSLHPMFDSLKKVPFGFEHRVPQSVKDLLLYDNPDIIVTRDDTPVFALERFSEVPTGHNVGQRFARAVRAAEWGVPFVFFFPFAALKHGKHQGRCLLNVRLLFAMKRLEELHRSHQVAVEWIHDGDHELVRDGSENRVMGRLLEELVGQDFAFDGSAVVAELKAIQEDLMREEVDKDSIYTRPPPSVRVLPTGRLASEYGVDLNRVMQARPKSLVYEIGMEPEKCRREDPYVGTQLVYDYCYCRRGPTRLDRHTNLVLSFPRIDYRTFLSANPMDTMAKSKLYYLFADMILFKDRSLVPWRH